MMNDLLLKLYDLGLIKFGKFLLSSGRYSTFYINLRVLPSFPELFKEIMEASIQRLNKVSSFDTICGIATGGIPFASYIAYRLEKPLIYIRKRRKEHGLKDLLVGYPRGTILIVDDVATTGSSLKHAISVLNENGFDKISLFVIVLRNKNLLEIFNKMGYKLSYLVDAKTILDALYKNHKIDKKIYNSALQEIMS